MAGYRSARLGMRGWLGGRKKMSLRGEGARKGVLRTLRPEFSAVCAHVVPQGSSLVADHKKALRLRTLRPEFSAVCAHVVPQGSSLVADHKKALRLRFAIGSLLIAAVLSAPAWAAKSPNFSVLPTVSTTPLIADDATRYTVTATAADDDGYNDLRTIRIIFDYGIAQGDQTKGRGFLNWGKTDADVTLFGGTWTIANATGGGRWGYATDIWSGTTYITPLSCQTSVAGLSTSGRGTRTVTFTFTVQARLGVQPDHERGRRMGNGRRKPRRQHLRLGIQLEPVRRSADGLHQYLRHPARPGPVGLDDDVHVRRHQSGRFKPGPVCDRGFAELRRQDVPAGRRHARRGAGIARCSRLGHQSGDRPDVEHHL